MTKITIWHDLTCHISVSARAHHTQLAFATECTMAVAGTLKAASPVSSRNSASIRFLIAARIAALPLLVCLVRKKVSAIYGEKWGVTYEKQLGRVRLLQVKLRTQRMTVRKKATTVIPGYINKVTQMMVAHTARRMAA